MKPTTLKILELFEGSWRYVIPLYQRRYVWSQKKQWEPLWRDVQGRAEAVLADERKVHPHFLGAVVWSSLKVLGRQVHAYEVIDGQQRLTTFQLLLAAFRDVTAFLDPEISKELAGLTENTGRRERDEERFKVWPTRFDQPIFEFILDTRDPAKVAEVVEKARQARQHVPALAAGYLFFVEAIRSWLVAGDAPARAEALFQALRNHLQVVIIDLDPDDDPQVIFETLNARGEPLQPADLVRNFVFNDASRTEEDVPRLFSQYWLDFDEDNGFWRIQTAHGRVLRDHLAWFLSAFLTVKLNEDVSDLGIFMAFKRWWSGRPERHQMDSAELGLKELRRYAGTYQRITQATGNSRLGLLTRRLEAMDLSTLTPILLYLLTEAQLPEAELTAVLDDLESYTVRRFIASLGSKNYNRFFLQLLQDLRRQGMDRGNLRALLSRGSGESVRWPDDEEVRQSLLDSPVYNRLRARGSNMLLEAIDIHLMTGRQEQLHIAEKLSVEHILPQRWRAQWPPPVAQEDGSDPALQRDLLLHTLGNLTLVTGKLNSGLSNGPYADKRLALKGQSRLRMNTIFQDQLTWDEDVIRRRGAEMARQVLEIWKGPDATHNASLPPVDVRVGNADVTMAQVRLAIEQLFPSSFLIQDLNLGFQLLSRDWARSLKIQCLFEEEVLEDGDAFTIGLYDAVRTDDVTKPDLQRAVLRVATQAELTFNEDEVRVNDGVVEVLLAEDTTAARLTGALIRFLTISVPELELALSLHPFTPRPAASLLATSITLLTPRLPGGYFLYSRNIRYAHGFQRVLYAGWDAALGFQVLPRADRILVTFRSDLSTDHPARNGLEGIAQELLAAAQTALPGVPVTLSLVPRLAVDVQLPSNSDAESVSETLLRLITALHGLIDGQVQKAQVMATPAS